MATKQAISNETIAAKGNGQAAPKKTRIDARRASSKGIRRFCAVKTVSSADYFSS